MSVAAEREQDKVPDVGNFITDPRVLTEKIQEWTAKGFHVLSPAIQVSSFQPGYGINASLVLLDHRVDATGRGIDVYYDKHSMLDHQRGPGKIGLGKLASAAGVSWIGGQCGRRDPLTIQNLWIYAVLGVFLAPDGTPQTIHGEKEIDYRDGSAQINEWSRARWIEEGRPKDINGWSEQRVMRARMNGAERAETGAMERAIRMAFGIKHVYSVDELSKPFVALRVVPMVDMQDPEVRQMVNAGKVAGVAALYAGRTADVVDINSRRQVAEPVAVGASSTPAAAARPTPAAVPVPPPVQPATQSAAPPAPATKPAPPSAPAPSSTGEPSSQPAPPVAEVMPANFIRSVQLETKTYGPTHAKAGQPFTKYHVIDGDGVEHITIREALGKKAQSFEKSKSACVITSAPNSFNERQISAIESFESAKAAAAPPKSGSYQL
jgi:hypothetical protein